MDTAVFECMGPSEAKLHAHLDGRLHFMYHMCDETCAMDASGCTTARHHPIGTKLGMDTEISCPQDLAKSFSECSKTTITGAPHSKCGRLRYTPIL